ncbi:hypothetical protein CS022_04950 [Veronia nyctiphanis]|uniref:Calx-beta domain-containing protein n=1 Tax=Veronia nyctiphanis TaxID=1278244 RepID=A0A4Q0YS46_9GAMM|nr:hypothetical protein [Veronia nyctiphanis]RXJ74002.1 hypothetical protein CS022_04950 [Veronia nyctiphanis]
MLTTVTIGGGNPWEQPITIPAGHTGVRLEAETTADHSKEGTETLTIQAYSPENNKGWVVSETADIIEIPRVDSVTKIHDGVESAGDNENEWVAWNINLSNASPESSTVRLVRLDTPESGGTAATNDVDYSTQLKVYFDLADGTTTSQIYDLSSTKSFTSDVTVPPNTTGLRVFAKPLDDNIYEGTESFTLNAISLNTGTPWARAVGSIEDDADKPTVSSVSSTTIDEGQNADVTITLSNSSTSTTKIWVDAYPDSANEDNDWESTDLWVNYGSGWEQAPGNFYLGNWIDVPANTTSFQVRMGTKDDSVYEGNESFTIRANAEGQSQVIGTVTITDDADKPTVTSVTTLPHEGIEGGTWSGWTLNLSNTSTSETNVRLGFNDYQHDATFSEDYSGWVHIYTLDNVFLGEALLDENNGFESDITIPANTVGVKIWAEPLDDSVYEGDETLTINARATETQSDWVESEDAVITDDSDKPTVTGVSDASANEGEAAALTVTLSNTSSLPTQVIIDAVPVDADELTDFNTGDLWVNFGNGWQEAPGDFTWGNTIEVPANVTTFQVRSQTTQDNTFEGNETYTIGARTHAQTGMVSGTVTIVDDADQATVTSITNSQMLLKAQGGSGTNGQSSSVTHQKTTKP